jgi:hypothetical protein
MMGRWIEIEEGDLKHTHKYTEDDDVVYYQTLIDFQEKKRR